MTYEQFLKTVEDLHTSRMKKLDAIDEKILKFHDDKITIHKEFEVGKAKVFAEYEKTLASEKPVEVVEKVKKTKK